MRAIGGYFEIEEKGSGIFPHKNGILLNTGRNALEYILRSIVDISFIYLPYYTCDVVLEPILKLKIPFAYYHINNLFKLHDDIALDKNQYIIVNNYFGINDFYVESLIAKYGSHLIIDNSQAFFAPPLTGVMMAYSCRKFLGVPDGGIAYVNEGVNVNQFNYDVSENRIDHLLIRRYHSAEAGYPVFLENEEKLRGNSIMQMSLFTRNILNQIDYQRIVDIRRENFQFLHQSLDHFNFLTLPRIDTFNCPMVYPLVLKDGRDLRAKLLNNKIFVAKYWPNVVNSRDFDTEVYLANKILPIPVDQRYGKEEMERILSLII